MLNIISVPIMNKQIINMSELNNFYIICIKRYRDDDIKAFRYPDVTVHDVVV